MASVEITASYFGHIAGSANSPDYSTARDTANLGPYATWPLVGQTLTTTTPNKYNVYRGFLKFDTSSLSGETITQVNLKLSVYSDSSTTDFDVQIVKYDWSGIDPLTTGNRDTAYDGCLAGAADSSIWRNTSGVSTATLYESGNLDTTWVNTSGNTYYALRSAEDYNNSAPTDNEYVAFGGNFVAAELRPFLVVTYGGGGGSSAPIHLIRTGMQPGMRIGL